MDTQPVAAWERAFWATVVSAGTMAFVMCGLSWAWASNGVPEPEQTLGSYRAHCLVMHLAMVVLQAPALFFGHWLAASIRGYLSLRLAVLCGMILPFLDSIAPHGNVFPAGPAGMAAYFVLFPLVATGVNLLPKNTDDVAGEFAK